MGTNVPSRQRAAMPTRWPSCGVSNPKKTKVTSAIRTVVIIPEGIMTTAVPIVITTGRDGTSAKIFITTTAMTVANKMNAMTVTDDMSAITTIIVTTNTMTAPMLTALGSVNIDPTKQKKRRTLIIKQ